MQTNPVVSYYQRNYALASAWSNGVETRLPQGRGFRVTNHYALTICSKHYDDSARTFGEINRDSPTAERMQQLLCLFCAAIEQAHTNMMFGAHEADDNAADNNAQNAHGNRADSDDDDGEDLDEEQDAMENAVQLQFQLDEEARRPPRAATSTTATAGADPTFGDSYARVSQTLALLHRIGARDEQHTRSTASSGDEDNDEEEEEAGDGDEYLDVDPNILNEPMPVGARRRRAPAVIAIREKGKCKQRMMVLLEELVHRDDPVGASHSMFPEYHNMMRKHTAVGYTIHVLTCNIDLNPLIEQIIFNNLFRALGSCVSTAKLSSEQRKRIFGVIDDNEETQNYNDARRGRGRGRGRGGRGGGGGGRGRAQRDYADDEAEEVNEGEEEEQNGRQRQAGQKRKRDAIIPRNMKSRRAQPMNIWEEHQTIMPNSMPELHGIYTGIKLAQTYYMDHQEECMKLTRDNPCNANNFFSIYTALLSRPADAENGCHERQTLNYYVTKHTARVPPTGDQSVRSLILPYTPLPTRVGRRDTIIWCAPEGMESCFRIVHRISDVYGANFLHKVRPDLQDVTHVLCQMWPGLFPLDPRSTMPELCMGIQTSARHHTTVGPQVRDPCIAGVAMTSARLERLIALAMEFDSAQALKDAIKATAKELAFCRLLKKRCHAVSLSQSVRGLVHSGSGSGSVSSTSQAPMDSEDSNNGSEPMQLVGNSSMSLDFSFDTNSLMAQFGMLDTADTSDNNTNTNNNPSNTIALDNMDEHARFGIDGADHDLRHRFVGALGESHDGSSSSSSHSISYAPGSDSGTQGTASPASVNSQDTQQQNALATTRAIDSIINNMTARDVQLNNQRVTELVQRMSDLQLISQVKDVWNVLTSERLRYRKESDNRDKWLEAYSTIYQRCFKRSMTRVQSNAQAGLDTDNEPSMITNVGTTTNPNSTTASDALTLAQSSIYERFDENNALFGSNTTGLLPMLDGKSAGDRLGLTISSIGDSNDRVLARLKELVVKRTHTMTNTYRRALMIVHERAALQQHRRLTANPNNDIPIALQVIYQCAQAENLLSSESRHRLNKIDTSMSVMGNLLAWQLEQYYCVLTCAAPKITQIGWVSSLTATCWEHSLKPNICLAGSAAASKTFPLMLLLLLRCNLGTKHRKKTTIEVTRETDQSMSVHMGALNNFVARIYNEMTRKIMVGEDQEDGHGSPVWKQLLDQLLVQVSGNALNKKTNQFESEIRYNEMVCVILAAINWPMLDMPVPMASRILCIQCMDNRGNTNSVSSAMERALTLRPADHNKTQKLYTLHHFLHYMHARIDMLIAQRAMVRVGVSLIGIVMSFINNVLVSEGKRPIPPRFIKFIDCMARALCTQEAIAREFLYPGGMFEFYDVTDERIMLLQPYLYVASRHIVTAIGMIIPYGFPQGEDEVRKGIWELLKDAGTSEGLDRCFKRVPRNMLAGMPQWQTQQRDAAVREQPHVPPGDQSALLHLANESSTSSMDFVPMGSPDTTQDLPGAPQSSSSSTSSYGASMRNRHHMYQNNGNVADGNYHEQQLVPDYRWLAFRRPEHGKNPFIQAANHILRYMARVTSKKFTTEAIAFVLHSLAQETIRTPYYRMSALEEMPVPVEGPETLVNIVEVTQSLVYVSYHWLRQAGECSVDTILHALKKLYNHRHQPLERHLWTYNDEFPNTFNVVELGNDAPNDDSLPYLKLPNANYMTHEEMLVVYEQTELDEHKWKECPGFIIDMSLDEYVARLHADSFCANDGPTTERDVVDVMYNLENIAGVSDTCGRYHGKHFASSDLDPLDNVNDIDMPEQYFQVPLDTNPTMSVHHADTVPFDEECPAARRAMYKDGLYYTLGPCVENRVNTASSARGLPDKSYPEVCQTRMKETLKSLEEYEKKHGLVKITDEVENAQNFMSEHERVVYRQNTQRRSDATEKLRNLNKLITKKRDPPPVPPVTNT